jgi:hypothetical protein
MNQAHLTSKLSSYTCYPIINHILKGSVAMPQLDLNKHLTSYGQKKVQK